MTGTAPTQSKQYEKAIAHLSIYESYRRSPYSSSKHSSYFPVYSELLEKYRNTDLVFVEIGVLNGGSLFMWRDYFGPKARIIGVEFNPGAKKWEKEGFEIHIGSQADPDFWKQFFASVGPVDVVLDDGGHTYEQQIVTAHECIPHIKDGGLLIVEDTHTSYFEEYGYPSRYSFIEWTKRIIDDINSRFPRVKVSNLPYRHSIFSVSIYESVVSFKIDRAKCFESTPTSNDGISSGAEDFRLKGSEIESMYSTHHKLASRLGFLRRVPLIRALKNRLFLAYRRQVLRTQLRKLATFFGSDELQRR